MMRYRNHAKNVRHRLLMRALLVTILVAVLTLTLFPRASGSVARTVFMPFLAVAKRLDHSAVGSYVASKTQLQKENDRLRSEVDRLSVMEKLYSLVVKENEELKRTFELIEEKNVVLARVLTSPKQTPLSTYLLDVGTARGVSEGLLVFSTTGVPIGTIVEVSGNSSVLELFSAPEKTTMVTFEPSGVVAQAVGKGGGNFKASIPPTVTVEKGEAAVTAHGEMYLLGEVELVEKAGDGDSFRVYFRTPVNLTSLRWVEVVIPSYGEDNR